MVLSYKSKLMHVEDDTLSLQTIRQNRNGYPRKDNNGGDDSSSFLTDDGHLWDTVIPENTYLSSNNTPPYLHTHSWYKIQDLLNQSRHCHKFYHSKMTEIIESNTILKVTYKKVIINLLINIKCIMIAVIDPVSPF